MRVLLTFAILLSQFVILNSQIETCFFDQFQIQLEENNPSYSLQVEDFDKQLRELQDQTSRAVDETILTVPVVIHVIHLPEDSVIGSGSNISNQRINDGIAYLNSAYRNINTYSGGPYYSNSGISSDDVKIEFCLAQQDTNGAAFDGVFRTSSPLSDLKANEGTDHDPSLTQERYMQSLSNQPSDSYLNIWLVNTICAYEGVNCGISGYAYFPNAHGLAHDGIIMRSTFWGTDEEDAKVQIHEVGHYLGLYHTFQGSCSETDCQTGGDRVCDTPPDSSTGAICGNNTNSCSNDSSIANSPFASDVEDIYENYMDYGSMTCQNTFTPGQKERMRNALQTTRGSLLNSVACQAVGVLPIEGIRLDGEQEKNEVILIWEIEGTEEEATFVIEKSYDGVHFVDMHQTEKFFYTDNNLSLGYNYYRIKYENLDGGLLYSNVLAFTFKEATSANIHPNPVLGNEIFITLNQLIRPQLEWELFDVNGRQFTFPNSNSEIINLQEIRLILPNISNGVYYLKEKNHRIAPIRFVKL